MDREAWQALVYGVAKSSTRLKRLSTYTKQKQYYNKFNIDFKKNGPPQKIFYKILKPGFPSQRFHWLDAGWVSASASSSLGFIFTSIDEVELDIAETLSSQK